MAVSFRDLRGEVLRYAPEAPTPLVIDVLRESAREFFTKSHAWRETIEIPLVDGQAVYDLLFTPSEETPPLLDYDEELEQYLVDVVSWHEVIYDDAQVVKKKTAAEVRRNPPRSSEIFWGFWNPSKNTIELIGTPGAEQDGNTLEITVSVQPARAALSISNDAMVDLYKDSIVNGAVGRMKMIPKQPWSDPSGAIYFLSRFEEGVLAADNRAQTQYSRHIVRTTTYGGL